MPLGELEKIQAVVTGSADQVREGLARYVAAGARHIVIRLGALDLHSQRDQLERIAALIPAVRVSADHASALGGSGAPPARACCRHSPASWPGPRRATQSSR